MGEHRKRAWWAVPLALAVLATACGGDDDEGAATVPTTAGRRSRRRAARRPPTAWRASARTTIVIQTDWFPEAEHGAPLPAGGRQPHDRRLEEGREGPAGGLRAAATPASTIEIRTGGPAIGFQQVVSQLKADPDILLGYIATDEAIENYADVPTKAIVAPLEIDPQIIMWDPAHLSRRPDDRRPRAQGRPDPLLRDRRLHAVPGQLGPGEAGPARRLLRRLPGRVHRPGRQDRPAGLRLLRALHLREADARVGQAGRLPAHPRRRLDAVRRAAGRRRRTSSTSTRSASRSSCRSCSRPRSTTSTNPDKANAADRQGGHRVQGLLGLQRRPGRVLGEAAGRAGSGGQRARRHAGQLRRGPAAPTSSRRRCPCTRPRTRRPTSRRRTW